MAQRERFQTKLEIRKLASEMFLTQGYSESSTKKIAQALDISVGNLAYHFPTKEHLLAELTEKLCSYHWQVMETEINEGSTSLLAYLLELTCMMAVCDENPVAKDLYTSVYRSSMPLKIIRESDTKKVKIIFAEYCPDWTEEEFAMTENIVSGIEYASILNENAETISLEMRITKTLQIVMTAYNVPKEIQQEKIKKVLALDHRRIGRRFVEGFTEYVEKVNEQALEEAHKRN